MKKKHLLHQVTMKQLQISSKNLKMPLTKNLVNYVSVQNKHEHMQTKNVNNSKKTLKVAQKNIKIVLKKKLKITSIVWVNC